MDIGFDWSTEKNRQLIEQRGISFERVVVVIEQDGPGGCARTPKSGDYPGQLIYAVEIDKHIHLVPFVTQTYGTRFLKTIIPAGRQREITGGKRTS